MPRWLVILSRVALASLLVLVTIFSLAPIDTPVQHPWQGFTLHVGAYFTLGLTADFAFPRTGYVRKAVAMMIYGSVIELLQTRIPHRGADPWDFTANALGLYAASVPALRLIPFVRRRWGL